MKRQIQSLGLGDDSVVQSLPYHQRQRQVNLCDVKASLVYRVSTRTHRVVTQRNPASRINNNNNNKLLIYGG